MKFIYKWRKLLLLILLALVIAYIAPKIYGITPEQLLDHKPDHPVIAAAIIVALYAVKPLIFIIPAVLLYIAAGLIFSPGAALLVGVIGLSVELGLGWLLGRLMGKEKIESLLQKSDKAEKLIGRVSGKAESVVFLTRLLPMPYPVGLGSMLFGASDVPFFKHLVFSIAGLSASMIPITIAGSSLEYPITADFFIPLAISFAIVLILFLIYKRFFNSKTES